MSYIKGAIPKNLLDQQAFTALIKKCDDYRKVTLKSQRFYGYLVQIFQRQVILNQRSLSQLQQFQKSSCPDYYKIIKGIFVAINAQNKRFSQTTDQSHKQMANCYHSTFLDLSNYILNFQQLMQNYQVQQNQINQLCKKYFKSLKTIQASIKYYKDALGDVKLVYNDPQKLKRYQDCQMNFQKIVDEYNFLDLKIKSLAQRKKDIIKCYENIENQLIKAIKAVGIKNISQSKTYIFNFVNRISFVIHKFIQAEKVIDRCQMQSFFSFYKEKIIPQLFTIKLEKKQQSSMPLLISEYRWVKDQQIIAYNECLLKLTEQFQTLVDERKRYNKNIINYIENYGRIIQKTMLNDMKQSVTYLNKIKKAMQTCFGQRTFILLKAIDSSFDLSLSINDKMTKIIDSDFVKIQADINDYNKQLDKFFKQFKTFMQKFMSKKEVRIITRFSSAYVMASQQKQLQNGKPNLSRQQIQKYKNALHSIMLDLIKVFNSNKQKLDRIDDKLKKEYLQFVHNIVDFQSQLHKTLICNYNNFFNQQNFLQNYKVFEEEVIKISQNQSQDFAKCLFGPLKTDKSKLYVDLQKHKFEEFLKLKKPVDDFQVYRQTMGFSNQDRNSAKQKSTNDSGLPQIKLQSMDSVQQVQSPTKQIPSSLQSKQSKSKYQQLLRSKVMFKQDEKIVDYFTCSLSDKITLHGKLFITNYRLCFHSKFNPNNVFFGGTLIQIPKDYILKIQKKKVLFINNGLLLTTIHGQVSFSGVYNRDEAYDLIISTFQINADNHFLEETQQQNPQLPLKDIIQIPLQDDINSQTLNQRFEKLDKQKNKYGFNYIQLYKGQVKKMDAYKLFKTFFMGQQININKRAYPSFLYFIKTSLNHTDIQIQNWSPQIKQHLNPMNIKITAPDFFKRTIKSVVPLKSAGVPFMPKSAKSVEQQTLLLYDRNKWCVLSKTISIGVPYCDTFQIHLRTSVQYKGSDLCEVKVEYYVNFVKNTMMKAIIQEKGKDDIIVFAKKRTDQINKYIKYIQGLKNKKKGGMTNAQVQQMQEQFQRQKTQLTQKNQQLTAKLQHRSSQSQKYKKILYISGGINIILLLIILLY